MPWESKSDILGIDSYAIESSSGQETNTMVAKAQAVLESSWLFNAGILSMAAAAIEAIPGAWRMANAAKAHAVLESA